MPTSRYTAFVDAIQYTGSNSAEVLASIPDYPYDATTIVSPYIASESGGVLVIELDAPITGIIQITMNTNDWATLPSPTQGSSLMGVTVWDQANNPLSNYYRIPADADTIGDQLLADPAFVAAIVDQVPEPDPQVLYTAVGKAALPALLLNGTTTPVVAFDQAMPDINYQLRWRAVSGATVLTQIVSNGTPTKTTSQVTIPLKAQGLASIAGVLLVEVFKLA